MSRELMWKIAKVLEAAGLIVVLIGVSMSVHLGFQEEGKALESMSQEFRGLMIGGGLFLAGYALERIAGTR